MITYEYDLDVTPGSAPVCVNLSQYDQDYELRFRLYSREGVLDIREGTTAGIRGTKKDRNGYSATAAISGNVVTVSGDRQMTAVAGRQLFEIRLEADGKELNTANFVISVERAPMDKDTIKSLSIIRELEDAEKLANKIIEESKRAEGNVQKLADAAEGFAREAEGYKNTAYAEADKAEKEADTAFELALASAASAEAAETARNSAEEARDEALKSEKSSADSAEAAGISEERSKISEEAAKKSEENAEACKNDAAGSAEAAGISEAAAKKSEENAERARQDAEESAATSIQKALDASASERSSAQNASDAQGYATEAESYTRGGTGTRPGEDIDNAKKYYEQAKAISESFSGALRPMGTVSFSNLPAVGDAVEGNMYNISDGFTTTADFKEGSGHAIPAGANVYLTADDKWDILAGTPVSGVKGAKEPDFRTGLVNITPENIGSPHTEETWLLSGGTAIPDSSNLNDYTTVGNYYSWTGTGITNLPPHESGAFILKVFNADGQRYRTQEIRMLQSGNTHQRLQHNYVWQEWRAILNDRNGVTLKCGVPINANADLNDFRDPGNFYCSLNSVAATLKNCPFGEAFTMKVILGTGIDYPTQIVRNFYSGRIAYRLGGVGWGAWNYILTNTDVLNDLTSAIVDRPLSANMGAYLKNLIGNGATGYMTSVNVDEMPIGITWVNGYNPIQGTVPWTGVHYMIIGQGSPGKTCLFQVAINRATGEVKARGRNSYSDTWTAWISSYATKSELSSYATKSELSGYVKETSGELVVNSDFKIRNCKLKKIGNTVFLQAELTAQTSVSAGSQVGTLPVGFRPGGVTVGNLIIPSVVATSTTTRKAGTMGVYPNTGTLYTSVSVGSGYAIYVNGFWSV